MALRLFLGDALGRRARVYRRALTRCRRHLSEDAVHDLRVESRRMRAALDAVVDLVPRRLVAAAAAAIDRRTRGLGSLRDAQLQKQAIAKLTSAMPALHDLERELARQVKRRSAKVARRIRRRGPRAVTRAVKQIRRALARSPRVRRGRRPSRPLVPALARAVAAAERRCAAIDSTQPASTHQARKALRVLRYTLELFQPVMPATTAVALDRLQTLQSEMGRLQDAAVLATTVTRFLDRADLPVVQARRIRAALVRRRRGFTAPGAPRS